MEQQGLAGAWFLKGRTIFLGKYFLDLPQYLEHQTPERESGQKQNGTAFATAATLQLFTQAH